MSAKRYRRDPLIDRDFDDAAVIYPELCLLRGGRCRQWPPGGGDRPKKMGPSCPVSPALTDLISESEEVRRTVKRLNEWSRGFVEW